MPKVSVVITTYNRAELLKRAIASVLNQTFQDFEIIVVDDASVDNTSNIVRALNENRLSYVRHGINKLEAGARNTGLQSAQGKYIAFLDDDDEWLPDKLRRQVEILDSAPPAVGAVYTGFLKIDSLTGKTLGQFTPTKRGSIFQDMFILNWVGTPSTVLLRKECFEKVGLFDEKLVFGVDYDMWIRISNEFHFEYIAEPLVRYLVHGSSMSCNYEQIIRGMETSNKKYEQFFLMHRKAFSERFYFIGLFYCLIGNISKGRRALMHAIRLYPFDVRYYFRLSICLLGAENFKAINTLKEKLTTSLKELFSV